jgi:predicted metalloprotease with PDZ domain
VTFVVQKQRETDDARSISGSTISSISNYWGLPITPVTGELEGVSPPEDVSFLHKNAVTTKMASDGSMIISKETETLEPVPSTASESWKLSGALAVAVKKRSPSQNNGIQIGIRDASNGRVLFVSDITKSSPFAQTPLRPGDVILSINDIDLEQNADVVDAYSALGKAGDEITILARKSSESLNEFLLNRKVLATAYSSSSTPRTVEEKPTVPVPVTSQRSSPASRSKGSTVIEREEMSSLHSREQIGPTSNRQKSPCPTGESFVFHEEAYGASLNGYNSSKEIRITKSHPQESIGLDLTPVRTKWGNFLSVTNIVPDSKAATTNIRVGDVILAINGVDFRDYPDVERALATIKRARTNVNIEVQHQSLYPFEISQKVPNILDNVTIHEHDNIGVVRTRTFDSNDDFIAQTCTLKIAGKSENQSMQGELLKDENMTKTVGGRRNAVSEAKDVDFSAPAPKQRKLWVRVAKEHPSEKVGISFATLEKKLVVTNVSPSGLLRGTPVLPGDTILSINRVDFRVDPDARSAFDLVSMAAEEVLFEILKTGYRVDVDTIESRSCLRRNFGCRQKKKQEYVVRLIPHEENGEDIGAS